MPKPLLWLLALASRGWNHPQRPRAILAGVSIGSSSAVYGDLNGLSAYARSSSYGQRVFDLAQRERLTQYDIPIQSWKLDAALVKPQWLEYWKARGAS